MLLLSLVCLVPSLGGCGPRYVRGSDVSGFDDPAMSLGLDRRDLEGLLAENLRDLGRSRLANEWRTAAKQERVAIFPIANETTQHVDPQLDSLLSDIEGYLVDSEMVDVISIERQDLMMRETDKQHRGGFDPTKIAALNRQMGTGYYVTGKVYTADERTADARRVQYFMHLQVIDVETSQVRWQHKADVTKGIVD